MEDDIHFEAIKAFEYMAQERFFEEKRDVRPYFRKFLNVHCPKCGRRVPLLETNVDRVMFLDCECGWCKSVMEPDSPMDEFHERGFRVIEGGL